MGKFHARRAPVFALAVLIGLGGAALRDVTTIPPAPPATAQAAGAAFGHHVDALEARRGEEQEIDLRAPRPAMRVHLKSRLPEPARLKYAVELTDDLGNQVRPPFESETVDLQPQAETDLEIELPRRLRRGFYLLRLTAVARAGDEFADRGIEIPFAVRGGKAYPLSDEEWLTYSAANFGD